MNRTFKLFSIIILILISCQKKPEVRRWGEIHRDKIVTMQELSDMGYDSCVNKYIGKIISFAAPKKHFGGPCAKWEPHGNACMRIFSPQNIFPSTNSDSLRDGDFKVWFNFTDEEVHDRAVSGDPNHCRYDTIAPLETLNKVDNLELEIDVCQSFGKMKKLGYTDSTKFFEGDSLIVSGQVVYIEKYDTPTGFYLLRVNLLPIGVQF